MLCTRGLRIPLLPALLLGMLCLVVSGRTFTVDDDGPADFPTIQAAIDDANDGDTVLVKPGTYTGPGNRDIVLIHKNITIRSERGPETCIIDCQGSPDEHHTDFSFLGVDSILDGFSVINGQGEYIAGISCDYGSPEIRNCIIGGNRAEWNAGAGIWLVYSNATVSNCLVSGNHGGGVMAHGGSPILSNCLVAGNYGGGLSVYAGRPVFSNCTIVGNRTEDMDGGGMVCGSASGSPETVVLNNCIIAGNVVKVSRYTRGTQILADPSLNIMGTNTVNIEIRNSYIGDDPNGIFVRLWANPSQPPAGSGVIRPDPLFARPGYWADPNDPNVPGNPSDPNTIWVDGDYHLKSQAGRWDPNGQSWAQDDITSPCIDAGDLNGPVGLEPFPNGGRIDMGAYGGTAEASKSYFGGPVCETIIAGDINGDCRVDLRDFLILSYHWMEGSKQP